MICKLLEIKGTWNSILNACRTTVSRDRIEKEPDSNWKRKLLLAEHSPIRKLVISAKWENLKDWVSKHMTRHKYGIEHFVKSQRTDRTGINRDELKQSELIEHEIEVNAQAIINISRKRLCKRNVSAETREAWKAFLLTIKEKEPELYSVCVPDCIYRGHCYEFNSCGYHLTDEWINEVIQYRKGINNG
jgi:hypothetical protein